MKTEAERAQDEQDRKIAELWAALPEEAREHLAALIRLLAAKHREEERKRREA